MHQTPAQAVQAIFAAAQAAIRPLPAFWPYRSRAGQRLAMRRYSRARAEWARRRGLA